MRNEEWDVNGVNVMDEAPRARAQHRSAPPQEENILPVFTAASLASVAIPPRDWYVEGLIPAYTVTLLNGDGGTGKSLLALQLAFAGCTDGFWCGHSVSQGPCLFLTAEDDRDEIHRRLADIARDAALDLDVIAELQICSLAGKDALLAVPEGKGNVLKATKLFEALDARVARDRPVLVVLDTLADLFGGEENQRAQARQFVGLLRGLCTRYRTTVFMLAHPSVAGMASGTGSSGSTAWNNSVRSRLYFDRVKQDQIETDTDMRVLKTVKSNYGKVGEEIALRWTDGVFKLQTGASGFTAMAAENNADRIFLDLLTRYAVEGRNVSATPSANYAPAKFAMDPRSNGIQKRGFVQAMNRLFEAGRIRVEETGSASRRLKKLVVVDINHAE